MNESKLTLLFGAIPLYKADPAEARLFPTSVLAT